MKSVSLAFRWFVRSEYFSEYEFDPYESSYPVHLRVTSRDSRFYWNVHKYSVQLYVSQYYLRAACLQADDHAANSTPVRLETIYDFQFFIFFA